ncbi:MAG TPA: hypothetical protein VFS23_42240, partial [Vicinamibacterales bacterium]|nr:hypothetical protein [Vicinamibacterales bacterium]
LFFPEGVAFSGKAFDRTVVTLFEYLRPLEGSNEKVVDQTGIVPVRRADGDADLPEPGMVRPSRAKRGLVDQNSVSWNHMSSWLRQIEALQGAA